MNGRNWMRAMLAGAAAVAIVSAAPAREAPAHTAAAGAPWSAAQGVVERYAVADKLPGVVAAVGRKGEPAAYLAAGAVTADAGASAADANSLWRIYSMTKPITGIAAMILVEEGKLKLDQPISDFFPAFKNMKVLTDPDNSLASRPAAREITVRHLLTHTAGLGYSIVTKGPLLAEYNRLGITPGAINRAMEASAAAARPKSLAEFAERVATLPLIADPGTKWSYSIALDLLPAIIEKAAGTDYESFLKARLLDPLDMRSTFFTVPAADVGRFATNYTWLGETRVALDPAATSVWLDPPAMPYGGAGLVSSARDYDRFLAMLLNGGELDGKRVLKPETVKLAMSNLLPAGTDTSLLNAATTSGATLGFGAGGSVYLNSVPGGAGKGTYGWAGAAGSIGWADPENGVRVTLMVNFFPMDRYPLRTELSQAIYGELAR